MADIYNSSRQDDVQFARLDIRIAYLQIRARISPLPVAKSSPDGLGATEITDSAVNCQSLKSHLLSTHPNFYDLEA